MGAAKNHTRVVNIVAPGPGPVIRGTAKPPTSPRRSYWLLAICAFNWVAWGTMSFLVFSQFLGIFWNASVSYSRQVLGRSPLEPLAKLDGFNDEPYADRAIVCLPDGAAFRPMQLSNVLKDPLMARVVDTSGVSINGMRVIKREVVPEMNTITRESFVRVCDQINMTLGAIQDSCDAIGYATVRDSLHAVDDIYSDTTREIRDALPIVMIQFWDNAQHTYYVIPGSDGMACVFRLNGRYQTADAKVAYFRGVPRAVREAKMVEWLKKTGERWRNGWYEAADNSRWFSNMMTSGDDSPWGLKVQYFDTLANKALDCNAPDASAACKPGFAIERWGKDFTTTVEYVQQNQVFVSNGTRFGIFMFEVYSRTTVRNVYSLETFISNVSVFALLFRWLVSLSLMLRSYRRGHCAHPTIGIASLSSSYTFNVLPVVLLPHLKMTLAVFWTAGCKFEGQQTALGDAWYAMYPGIIEFVFIVYSLLNAFAKIAHRRMSDALFGPTVLFLCGLHFFRSAIAASQLFGFNGRLSSVVLSDEFDALTIFDLLTSKVSLRMNGNAKNLYYIKIVVVALNIVPLLLAERMSTNGKKHRGFSACDIERSLALRASNVGGLGRSPVYQPDDIQGYKPTAELHAENKSLVKSVASATVSTTLGACKQRQPTSQDILREECDRAPSAPAAPATAHELIGYELSRLGYLVFGGKYLVTYEDWYVVTSMAPLRVLEKLWNHRVSVFDIKETSGGWRVSRKPRLCRLDDPELRKIPFYDISVHSFR